MGGSKDAHAWTKRDCSHSVRGRSRCHGATACIAETLCCGQELSVPRRPSHARPPCPPHGTSPHSWRRPQYRHRTTFRRNRTARQHPARSDSAKSHGRWRGAHCIVEQVTFFCKRVAGARDGPAKRRRKEPARWAQRKVSARILSQPTSALGQSCMCSTRVLQREVSGIPRTGCSSDETCEASESVIESGREVGRACRMGPVGARRSAAGLATTARSFDSRSGTWIETVFLISANNV